MLQMKELVKGKEKRREVWCTTCRVEGHHQNECLVMEGYTLIRVLNLFPWNCVQWCEICQTWGHTTHNFTMLNKYQNTDHIPFFEFYNFVGNDVKNC